VLCHVNLLLPFVLGTVVNAAEQQVYFVWDPPFGVRAPWLQLHHRPWQHVMPVDGFSVAVRVGGALSILQVQHWAGQAARLKGAMSVGSTLTTTLDTLQAHDIPHCVCGLAAVEKSFNYKYIHVTIP
jgi:hypothetical protein